MYNRIVRGDVYTRTVTIPEGYNLFDIAQAVEDAQLGSKDGFLAAASQDVALIADLDPGAKSLEGYLFPDTYRFPRRLTAAADAGRDGEEVSAEQRGDRPGWGLSPGGHPGLAGGEGNSGGGGPAAGGQRAQNRLAKEMPLMTDPTVIYAAMLENRYRGTIYQSDLKRDSAYNTYRHAGLPPGPICSPGTASLQAAMHPADSHFLYFVADPAAAGHSRFAATLEEHERNVTAYRRGP